MSKRPRASTSKRPRASVSKRPRAPVSKRPGASVVDAQNWLVSRRSTRSRSDRRSNSPSPVRSRSTRGLSSSRPPRGGPPASGEDMLARGIQATLYDRCYAERHGADGAATDAAFSARLRAANTGRERWDRGWIIHQFGPNGQAFVRKGDRERAAMPGAFIFDGPPGMAPQIGSQISLRASCETLEAQPGYYFAFGETLDELADQLSLTRLYFHCAAENAASLVGELTSAFNRFQTPFQMKTPAAPALYWADRRRSSLCRPTLLPHRGADRRASSQQDHARIRHAALHQDPLARDRRGSRTWLRRKLRLASVPPDRRGDCGRLARRRTKDPGPPCGDREALSRRGARPYAPMARPTGFDPFERPQSARLP